MRSIINLVKKVTLSFIIPAFNEAKLLPATLKAIKQAAVSLDNRGLDWELIVCDNNSSDTTAHIARSLGARVAFEPVNQIARARNRGASIAKGSWLVFVDADSMPSGELMEELAMTLLNPQVAGGGCVLEMDQPLHSFWMFWVRSWNWISVHFRLAAGSFVFCRADGFRAVGGFPDDCYTGEEIWFSRRLKHWGRNHGMKFVILQKYPLVTSARKISLYSGWELARTFLAATVLYPFIRHRRKAWFMWYDGRR